MVDWKAVKVNWDEMIVFDHTHEAPVCLTQREIATLKAVLSVQYWPTRWDGTFDNDEMETFVATIDRKLDGGQCTMTDCEDIADCIETSETTQAAISNYISETGQNGGIGNPEQMLPTSITNESLLPTDFPCDYDHIWAICLAIVEAIHSAVSEVFQALEVATNPVEIAAELLDNVPIIGLAASAAEIAEWALESAAEAYELAWSPVIRDEIACELFCAVKDFDPCKISYDDVYAVYTDVWSEILPPPARTEQIWEWLEWLISLPLTIEKTTVKIAGCFGLIPMAFASVFGGFVLGIRSLKMVIDLERDNTSPDWAILCTDCPTRWTHYFDFEVPIEPDGWSIGGAGNGNFVANVGYVSEIVDTGNLIRNLVSEAIFDYPGGIPNLDRIKAHYDGEKGHWGSNMECWQIRTYDPALAYTQWNQGNWISTPGTYTHSFSINSNIFDVRLLINSCWTLEGNTGEGILTGCTMSGIGIDPFL